MRQLFSILCDDIRFEQNNKVSLIGVYPDNIIVPKLPFVFTKLCIAQEYEDTKGLKKLKLVLRGPKLNLPPVEATLKPNPGGERGHVRLPLLMGPIRFETEGEYVVEIYFNDAEEPNFINKFSVRLRSKEDDNTPKQS